MKQDSHSFITVCFTNKQDDDIILLKSSFNRTQKDQDLRIHQVVKIRSVAMSWVVYGTRTLHCVRDLATPPVDKE
ncbi:unnamed protein product [Colias eurytheme]|nr:unnamed protein product [Colias eurytheme]